MEDLNLFIVNSLNFCRKQFFRQVLPSLFIGPFTSKRFYPSGRSTKFNNLIWILSRISWLQAINGVRPIIASLYVIGSQLFNNNPLSSNVSFDNAFNQFFEVQQIFRYPVFTTPCRHESYECRSCLQNSFWYCSTLIILLRFNNIIKLYCPPTFFSRNNPLCDKPILHLDLQWKEYPVQSRGQLTKTQIRFWL